VNDWASRVGEVHFDPTENLRPETGILSTAQTLTGAPAAITSNTDPSQVVVQVGGVAMRLITALQMGLVTDEMARHVNHPSATPAPAPTPAEVAEATQQEQTRDQAHAPLFDAERSAELTDMYNTLANHGVEPNSFALGLIRGSIDENSEGVQMLARDTKQSPADILAYAEEIRGEVIGALGATLESAGYDSVGLLNEIYETSPSRMEAAGLAALSSGSLANLLSVVAAHLEQRPTSRAKFSK
jgi:hypothetical protein